MFTRQTNKNETSLRRRWTDWLFQRRRLPSPETIIFHERRSNSDGHDSGLDEYSQSPSASSAHHSPVSAQRKLQWQQIKQQKYLDIPRLIPKLTVRQSSIDHSDQDVSLSLVVQNEPTGSWKSVEEQEDKSLGMGERSPSSRFPPLRKFRSPSSKPSTSSASVDSGAWKSFESYTWRSTDGFEVTVRGTHIQYLSLLERAVLQKISLQAVQKANLGCSISKPKELSGDSRVDVLRYLLGMLPISNCDTLFVLLKFLQEVAKRSSDLINDQGVVIYGNKMNSRNLATIFAPSLLRPGPKEPPPTLADNESVISVMETMILHCNDIFFIPKEIQQKIYRSLGENNIDTLDQVMQRLKNRECFEREGDTSGDAQECTVFYSSQDETFPDEITNDADGSTCIKTKQTTTHRIVYKVHKHSDQVVESEAEALEERLLSNDDFPDLKLFIDDDHCVQDDPVPLINPSAVTNARQTFPIVSKLGAVVWPKHKSSNKEPR